MAAESTKTILLSEDDPGIRRFVLDLLQNSSYTVIIAEDGIEALEKSRAHPGPIHLLLSNIQMPRMTGIELATQLQTERPETKVLLMSGLDSGMLLLGLGWEFLPKPVAKERLEDKIRTLLEA